MKRRILIKAYKANKNKLLNTGKSIIHKNITMPNKEKHIEIHVKTLIENVDKENLCKETIENLIEHLITTREKDSFQVIDNIDDIEIINYNSVKVLTTNNNLGWGGRVQSVNNYHDYFELSFQVSDYYSFICLTTEPDYPIKDILGFATIGLYFDEDDKLNIIFDKFKNINNISTWNSTDIFKIILKDSVFSCYKNEDLIYTLKEDKSNEKSYYAAIAFNSGSVKQKSDAIVSNITIV